MTINKCDKCGNEEVINFVINNLCIPCMKFTIHQYKSDDECSRCGKGEAYEISEYSICLPCLDFIDPSEDEICNWCSAPSPYRLGNSIYLCKTCLKTFSV